MARRIPFALVVVFAFCIASLGQTPSSVLVRYSFEEASLDTGPDTFAIFQHAKGSVHLSTQNRFSGYYSVEIRDVAGDKDFPELQGYFQLRTHGRLFAHFALMTTNPAEELNVALAGPQWFGLRKDGIGFWLKTIDGYLCHYSDSMPKKLFMITPFLWYIVNVAYDIDAGTYDLVIYQENQQNPIISLQNQLNAAKQPGSAVDKFSFIGDAGTDESNVIYYVDDVLIGVDESVTQPPFAAPGRRKLFIDYWNEFQRDRVSRPTALPLIDFSDLGISSKELQALRQTGFWELLEKAIASTHPVAIPQSTSVENQRLLHSVNEWIAGNEALHKGQAATAFERFETAARLAPSGKIYRMDAAISLAALGNLQQADDILSQIYADWRDDIRFPLAAAMLGIARQDLGTAEQWLRESVNHPSIQPMKERIAEQYFYVLLWQGKVSEAQEFAQAMANLKLGTDKQQSIWIERLGDTAFMLASPSMALTRYEESLRSYADHPDTRILLKLCDVYWRLGDFDKERHYRELIYGRLTN